jgi:hypothetical protein
LLEAVYIAGGEYVACLMLCRPGVLRQVGVELAELLQDRSLGVPLL